MWRDSQRCWRGDWQLLANDRRRPGCDDRHFGGDNRVAGAGSPGAAATSSAVDSVTEIWPCSGSGRPVMFIVQVNAPLSPLSSAVRTSEQWTVNRSPLGSASWVAAVPGSATSQRTLKCSAASASRTVTFRIESRLLGTDPTPYFRNKKTRHRAESADITLPPLAPFVNYT